MDTQQEQAGLPLLCSNGRPTWWTSSIHAYPLWGFGSPPWCHVLLAMCELVSSQETGDRNDTQLRNVTNSLSFLTRICLFCRLPHIRFEQLYSFIMCKFLWRLPWQKVQLRTLMRAKTNSDNFFAQHQRNHFFLSPDCLSTRLVCRTWRQVAAVERPFLVAYPSRRNASPWTCFP